jgi:hypothetical protein
VCCDPVCGLIKAWDQRINGITNVAVTYFTSVCELFIYGFKDIKFCGTLSCRRIRKYRDDTA